MGKYRNEITAGVVAQAPLMSELAQSEMFQYVDAVNNGVYMKGNGRIIHLQTGEIYQAPNWDSLVVRLPQVTIKTVIV